MVTAGGVRPPEQFRWSAPGSGAARALRPRRPHRAPTLLPGCTSSTGSTAIAGRREPTTSSAAMHAPPRRGSTLPTQVDQPFLNNTSTARPKRGKPGAVHHEPGQVIPGRPRSLRRTATSAEWGHSGKLREQFDKTKTPPVVLVRTCRQNEILSDGTLGRARPPGQASAGPCLRPAGRCWVNRRTRQKR